jgi:uncharacterized NAD(P)/FAD-binding protein YdhS
MSNPTESQAIAIIGAGCSGTLLATHLLKLARGPFQIHVIERDPTHVGRGVAYSTLEQGHLLNVPAANMSAFAYDPAHFLGWAETHPALVANPPGPGSFLPRRVYGDYLNWILDEALKSAREGVQLVRHIQKVSRLDIVAEGVSLGFADGETLTVGQAVLAVGNFPPGNPAIADSAFYASPRYHRNPWLPGLLPALLQTEACLLIGSGLTMVDWAVSLAAAGYQGKIHVVSRRGFWPKAHQPADPVSFSIDPAASPSTVRAWLRQIRQSIAASHGNWRGVMDALRPHTQTLWNSLPPVEQRRFLRHLRPFWDVHRHRLAPPVADNLERLLASGQLRRHVGTITEYREAETEVAVAIRLRTSRTIDRIRVGAVINCSGSDSNYRRLESTLIRNLLEQGLIRPDRLALGLDVTAEGALIGNDGRPSDRLYTLGPPARGLSWETTAVPEIRNEARRLAEWLVCGGGNADG